MAPRKTRPFNLLDAVILLASVAAGLAWARADIAATIWVREQPSGTILGNHMLMRPVRFSDRLFTFRRGAAHLLACWTAALLLLRLRRPRPHAAPVMRQPGAVAVATAVAYNVVVAGGFAMAFFIRAKYKPQWSDYAAQAIDVHGTAMAITAAWVVLAFSGRWCADPSWIDRSCRVIGLAWIGLWISGDFFDWW